MIILVPFLVALIGLIMILAAKEGKPQRIGEILLLAGLIVGLMRVGGVINLLGS